MYGNRSNLSPPSYFNIQILQSFIRYQQLHHQSHKLKKFLYQISTYPNLEKIRVKDPLSLLQPIEIIHLTDVADVEAQDIKNETAHDINVYVALNSVQDIILMNVQTMKINNLEKIYSKH